jgi:regulator of cell morphogenesis and NO signaling
MKSFKDLTVGEIVTEDFRAAEVFKKAGIDFCCGGNRRLDVIASEKKLDITEIESELNNLDKVVSNKQPNFKEWSPDFLCDYIVNEFHNKVYRFLPQLMEYVNKIAQVHGVHHPELIKIAEHFSMINTELPIHQKQEEHVFFPAIKDALKTGSADAMQIIASQISLMTDEHEIIGGTMEKINELSRQYAVPDDACNTYRVTYEMLREFEDDLHTHVHIENNILFPKALKLVV